ncbi:tellurium resistance protein TerA [Novosphingobium barchaimii LL02]|uniref:Tellurium resistance protein TerA n=1 Tax=Novosphingobium barchaimii LL02 TaxID=1114963 RepID=A0A0J7XXG0_9SPHN|nr:TerD family protein [Novosphingobium barchaimii]KMS56222.1 tellurium resistance protein TerA [Novosphingobium barchaimii LL02]
MTDLQQGGNASVPADRLTVSFAWTPTAGREVDADASAYLLTASGKVRSDADMVFYNQPQGGDGGVRFVTGPGQGTFEVDLSCLPPEIERVVFCVTIHEAQAKGQTLALLEGALIDVATSGGGSALRFVPSLAGAAEAAMTFGELYLRNGQWKFRAVGQGFTGGLAPLARSFGIDVAEDAPAAAPPPPPPAPKPVSLSKVTLEKAGQTVSLEKRGSSFGEITINLNWSRGRKGFFGGGSAIDLDLGCLFELSDGRKGVVQALGNAFGSFAQEPFIALSGDDRTGDVSQGETMRINGARWADIRRIAIFANIYDGVPNWQQTDGVVLVSMPDQPPIEVRMTEGQNDRRLCGIVLIENDAGRLKVTRIVDYVRDQKVLDESLGWGLRWVAGRKD